MSTKENPSIPFTGSTSTLSWANSTSVLVTKEEIDTKNNSDHEIYNPYQNRVLTHPNGFTGAFVHIVKTSLGTGILAIPRAFRNAGLLVGFIGTILVGTICTHSIHILSDCSFVVWLHSQTQ